MKKHKASSVRTLWVEQLLKCAGPVLENLAQGRLNEVMPIEQHPLAKNRSFYAKLEAFGRTLAGIGPWLELEEDEGPEQGQRKIYRSWAQDSLRNLTDPASPDFMDFSAGSQTLVDTAFIAQGLLRSWSRCWLPLDEQTKEKVVDSMIQTRRVTPPSNNWLLFSAMVEAFLYRVGADWDRAPIDAAI